MGTHWLANTEGKDWTKMKVYGIKNCDTVKKSLKWLKENNIPFDFHNYKKEGISENKLREWSKQVGWENLINRRGTTWRKLDETTKEKVIDETHAIDVMLTNTSVIKRPVIEKSGSPIIVGYDEEKMDQYF